MSNVKKAVAIIIVLSLFAALVFFAVTRGNRSTGSLAERRLEEVMALDFSQDYPEQPDKVLAAYNDIDAFLSGNTFDLPNFTDDDLRVLVEKQRELMDAELLGQNPVESHIEGYRAKMEYLKEEDLRIVQINTETPVFSYDPRRCSIVVKQFWNKHVQIDLNYYLRRENGSERWKISGWEER